MNLDRGGTDQPRTGGLIYEPQRDCLYVNLHRHYNVPHRPVPLARVPGQAECGFGPGSIVWLPQKHWLLIPQGGRSEPMVHVLKVSRKTVL